MDIDNYSKGTYSIRDELILKLSTLPDEVIGLGERYILLLLVDFLRELGEVEVADRLLIYQDKLYYGDR